MFFGSDSIGVRVTMRVDFGFPYPVSVVRIGRTARELLSSYPGAERDTNSAMSSTALCTLAMMPALPVRT